jgi:hypothetical protein
VADRGTVELLGPGASVVGKGVIDGNIKCGTYRNPSIKKIKNKKIKNKKYIYIYLFYFI